MRVVAVAVAVLTIAGHNVLAQVAKPEDASARELAKLNATMREVAELLTKQVAHGQLDLLMKRTQMALDQVERAETLLRQAQDERTSVEEERSRLEGHREVIAAQEKVPAEERDATVAGIDVELKRLAQRQNALEGKIVELQNRIAERQDELRGWQALVDRRLGGQ
jgi:chromosome segregation ATPase